MIYAISDLHLDVTKEKDMNVFGDRWDDYENRIFKNWEIIQDDDLVLIAGDISWAMSLEDARKDLDRIDDIPGTKLLMKGNHDYWWSSLNKIKQCNFKSLHFLQNNSFVYKGTRICGTRGWISKDDPEFTDQDEKIFNRELNRLILSLDDKKEDYEETIVMLHYPPFNKDGSPNEYEAIFKKYDIKTVMYGHIHGDHVNRTPEGIINGIEYICTSADKLEFKAILIRS